MRPDSPEIRSKSIYNFNKARQLAFWQAIWGLLTRKSIDLLRFEEVKHRLRLYDERYVGLQNIELAKIVGSVGRYRDFTRTFLPRTDAVRSRWQRLDALARGSEGFPPIEVYKVGDAYFVLDGNHRVSVARQLGAKTIEAYVTELPTHVPIDSTLTVDELLIKEGYADFLSQTHLDMLRPEANVILTEPSRYGELIEHISVHRYFMGIEQDQPVTWSDAVQSWHDNVYMPMIMLIREYDVLEEFPERTEADLYTWLIRHQESLRLQLGGEWQTAQATVDDFMRAGNRL